MKKELFNAIKNRIIERVPDIVSFALFNKQFDQEKKNNPVKLPALLIEFESFEWKSQSFGIQTGNTNIKFRLFVETYSTNAFGENITQPNDLSFLDLVKKIHTHIHGFDGEFFTPLLRVDEIQNTDHDNVLSWEITYSTQITDDSAHERYSRPLVNMIPDVTDSLTFNVQASID